VPRLLRSSDHIVGLGVGEVCIVGEAVGVVVGSNGVGLSVGAGDGRSVGEAVGDAIGSGIGVIVGAAMAETDVSVILFVVSGTVPNATMAAAVIVIFLYIITPLYVHQT
jgi:hypothetical protein